jgi:hypothetical protein
VLAADVEVVLLRALQGGADRAEAARKAGLTPRELSAVLAAGERQPGSAAWQFLAKVEAVERGEEIELPRPTLRQWLGQDRGRP